MFGYKAVLRNYGALLVDMCKVVPDGIVCFFPSYFYLEQVGKIEQFHCISNYYFILFSSLLLFNCLVGVWNETGVLKAALVNHFYYLH